jgi:hypothetical protein
VPHCMYADSHLPFSENGGGGLSTVVQSYLVMNKFIHQDFQGTLCDRPVLVRFIFPNGDRLLPQAEITLNLLRTSRLYPQLSTEAHFNGLIDYNKTAFAPPGCNIIAHKNYHKGELGNLIASQATHWVQLCIIKDVTMYI